MTPKRIKTDASKHTFFCCINVSSFIAQKTLAYRSFCCVSALNHDIECALLTDRVRPRKKGLSCFWGAFSLLARASIKKRLRQRYEIMQARPKASRKKSGFSKKPKGKNFLRSGKKVFQCRVAQFFRLKGGFQWSIRWVGLYLGKVGGIA